jgi:hypothetical protein
VCRPWRPPAGVEEDGRRPLSPLPGNDFSRLFADQRLGLEDTSSRGKIYKEPLCFYEIEPAVLGVIQELRFFVLKAYFFSVIQKYVF